MKTVVKKEPIAKISAGMNKAEVLKILSPPAFTSSSGNETIFFYCTYLLRDTSKAICIPIYFQDEKVTAVGKEDSQKWTLDMVQSKMEADRKEMMAKTESVAKPPDGIAEETLNVLKTFTPRKGETVYVNYHTGIIRSVPLRSNPTDSGRILKTLCIGSELAVLAIRDPWLYVKWIDKNYPGWILKRWVTNDPVVKIDAEKRRRENASEIARLESLVKPIPMSKWKENLQLYKALLELYPCNVFYQRKVEFYVNYGRRTKKRKR